MVVYYCTKKKTELQTALHTIQCIRCFNDKTTNNCKQNIINHTIKRPVTMRPDQDSALKFRGCPFQSSYWTECCQTLCEIQGKSCTCTVLQG